MKAYTNARVIIEHRGPNRHERRKADAIARARRDKPQHQHDNIISFKAAVEKRRRLRKAA